LRANFLVISSAVIAIASALSMLVLSAYLAIFE